MADDPESLIALDEKPGQVPGNRAEHDPRKDAHRVASYVDPEIPGRRQLSVGGRTVPTTVTGARLTTECQWPPCKPSAMPPRVALARDRDGSEPIVGGANSAQRLDRRPPIDASPSHRHSSPGGTRQAAHRPPDRPCHGCAAVRHGRPGPGRGGCPGPRALTGPR